MRQRTLDEARGTLPAGSAALWEVEASAGDGWRAPAAVRIIEQVPTCELLVTSDWLLVTSTSYYLPLATDLLSTDLLTTDLPTTCYMIEQKPAGY